VACAWSAPPRNRDGHAIGLHHNSGARKTKSPGPFRCNPGFEESVWRTRYASPVARVARARASFGCATNRGSPDGRAQTYPRPGEARRTDKLSIGASRITIPSFRPADSNRVPSPDVLTACALTRRNQEARSACAVRASGELASRLSRSCAPARASPVSRRSNAGCSLPEAASGGRIAKSSVGRFIICSITRARSLRRVFLVGNCSMPTNLSRSDFGAARHTRTSKGDFA
jgi:hypothetical protein